MSVTVASCTTFCAIWRKPERPVDRNKSPGIAGAFSMSQVKTLASAPRHGSISEIRWSPATRIAISTAKNDAAIPFFAHPLSLELVTAPI